MTREFSKSYEAGNAENKWYEIWQANQIFRAYNTSDKKAYSILMPPPNVTGILHFGHVLNQTIQDLYIRSKRMQGYETCWFPGTDHAGIATQTKVEAELRKEKITRYDLGREKFTEKVWEWKEKYGGIIISQLRKLGISSDWSRLLFTMDESASNAVREVFIRLFDEGLIYRGKRIINWSPLSQTALSDEEVEFREVKEKLYTLRYKFENGDGYLCVATARPETIFGDVAIAINPNDERYAGFLGSNVIVPLVGRAVKVIADDYADPAFGTGCVKITPAHDPNDFEVGLRHGLEMLNTINPDATLNNLTGEYNGMDRFAARKAILRKLEELELIEKIEDYTHNVGFSQRGGEAIEPYLSDQWFVKMKPLAEIAIGCVQNGDIKFHPNHWVKTYEHWLNGIRDWCISRQLWWGHRIPVYYTNDGRYTAADTESEARKKLNISGDIPLRQDEDVLDTWFSSWLWPMTTMHWLADGVNEKTDDINKFLPTDLLVTAPDIIFFWVARMIMASQKFTGKIPFRNVYFTSTIRDNQGRKLSKSLGNSPDPLHIIDKYGADAVRFTMVYLSPLGQDIKLDIDLKSQDIPSMEIGRNFANKIWNAGRFLLMKNDALSTGKSNPGDSYQLTHSDKWILSRYNSTINKIIESLDDFRLNEYSKILYDFIWRDFCDWYLEILKVQTSDESNAVSNSGNIALALDIYEGILKLIHPIMPFISEDIWHIISEKGDGESICLEKFPEADGGLILPAIETSFEMIQMLVEEIRSLRANLKIPPGQRSEIVIIPPDTTGVDMLMPESDIISSLARCSSLEIGLQATKPAKSIASVVRDFQVFIALDQNINIDGEKERLNKEIERIKRNIDGTEKKLANEKFVANAPDEVVAYEREKLLSMRSSLEKIIINYNSLN
jgi:valyl-tRNA synthetase